MASIEDRVHFAMMSLVHETVYGWVRDPYESLQAAGLAAGQRVLEVGCGPGHFTVPAAEIVGPSGSLYALDVSPHAIQRVVDKAKKEGATNVTPVLADAAQTGLSDDYFDVVFVFGLHDGRDVICDELCRVLKPEGILATEGILWPTSESLQPMGQQGNIHRFRKVAPLEASGP
jgi:ubiquinone/menaquinone biosynthesis C-methylase UbiE